MTIRRTRCGGALGAPARALLALLMASTIAAGAQDARFGDAWRPEIAPAYRQYLAGNFTDAVQVCQSLQAQYSDRAVRRDARVLSALATMRMSARTDRIDGTAALTALAQEDPGLWARPECRLAYGIAKTALHETSAALSHLLAAEERFGALRATDRLAETYIALARAWSIHSEWELGSAGLRLPIPESASAALERRREQIAKIRQRAADLPGAERTLERIDLIRAEMLLESAENRSEGIAILERITATTRLTATIADACMLLGAAREDDREWSAALALYERVEHGRGPRAADAEQRANAIRRPQLELEIAATVRPRASFAIELSARNVENVACEIRRVDLSGWLAERQGRFVEAQLPVAGSVESAFGLDTHQQKPYAWWRTASLDSPPTAQLSRGAFVVVARAADGAGGELVRKRLVIASELQAAIFTGSGHVLVWARGSGGAEVSARFWMHGSFVPVRAALAGGVVRFPLPAEAYQLVDKRWACLVEADGQMALCRGTLSDAVGRDAPAPRVALIGGPPNPEPGTTVRVFGLVLDPPAGERAARGADRTEIDLRLVDRAERVRQTVRARVRADRTFAARFVVDKTAAGESLRVEARRGGRVLEPVRETLRVRVPPADAPRFLVRADTPAWNAADATVIEASVIAEYPWGVGLDGAALTFTSRGVRLVTNTPREPAVPSGTLRFTRDLDAGGRSHFLIPRERFDTPPGPLAVGFRAELRGWDNRMVRALGDALIGSAPVHVWIERKPGPARVDRPVGVFVGWFDPGGVAASPRPRLEVYRADQRVHTMRLIAAPGGLFASDWIPDRAGTYELRAVLPLSDGGAAVASEIVEVGTRDELPAGESLDVRAHVVRVDEQTYVDVQIEGASDTDLLIVLENGNPLGALVLPTFSGTTRARLPIEAAGLERARVWIVRFAGSGLHLVAATPVRPDPQQAIELSATVLRQSLEPGAAVPVDVRISGVAGDDPVTMIVRLSSTTEVGVVPWSRGREIWPAFPTGQQVRVSSSTGSDVVSAVDELPAMSPELIAALYQGGTLWIDSRVVRDQRVRFRVPLPNQPGRFELLILARTSRGVHVVEELTLDTRTSVYLDLEAPEDWVAGDRTQASLRLVNNTDRSETGDLRLALGGGLHLERFWTLSGPAVLRSAGASDRFEVELAPHSSSTIGLSIEAARVGRNIAVATLESQTLRRKATCSYRVRALASSVPARANASEPDAGGAPTVTVARRIFKLEPPPEATDGSTERASSIAGRIESSEELMELQRTAVATGEPILPGQLLLVEEDIRTDAPLADLVWTQRLPANCHTYKSAAQALRRVGYRTHIELGSLTFSTERVESGLTMHEYLLVPVRPGACLIPWPEVSIGGQRCAVQVAPEEQRVLVSSQE